MEISSRSKTMVGWALLLIATPAFIYYRLFYEPTPEPKTPEQLAAEAARAEQAAALAQQQAQEFLRKREERELKLDESLRAASEQEIRGLVSSCKALITDKARADNRSMFEIFLVDEYTADRWQAVAWTAGASVSTLDERVSKFLTARDQTRNGLEYLLDLSFGVVFTEDSFSGPVKTVRNYRCRMEQDLSLTAHAK